MNPEDELEIEGQGNMTYGEFKEKYLPVISGFYPTVRHWLLKNYKSRTINEFQETGI